MQAPKRRPAHHALASEPSLSATSFREPNPDYDFSQEKIGVKAETADEERHLTCKPKTSRPCFQKHRQVLRRTIPAGPAACSEIRNNIQVSSGDSGGSSARSGQLSPKSLTKDLASLGCADQQKISHLDTRHGYGKEGLGSNAPICLISSVSQLSVSQLQHALRSISPSLPLAPPQALTPSKSGGVRDDANEHRAHAAHRPPLQAQGKKHETKRGTEGGKRPKPALKTSQKSMEKKTTNPNQNQPTTQSRSPSESSKGWLQSQNADFIPPSSPIHFPLPEADPKIRAATASAGAGGMQVQPLT